jgi:hypothetical protein
VDSDRFWSFLDVLNGEITEDSARRFQVALTGLDAEEIWDFTDTLRSVLHAVDLNAFVGMPLRDVTDSPDGTPLPLVGTALEYFAGALVAAGQETYLAALADPPSVLSRTWRTEDAPLLLEAVSAVCEHRTGSIWDDGQDYSGLLTTPDDSPSAQPWLSVGLRLGTGQVIPHAYDAIQDALLEGIRESALWQAWWNAARWEQLRMVIDYRDTDSGRFTRGRKYFDLEYHADYQRLPGADPSTLGQYATEDLLAALRVAAENGGLGPLPPMPPVPAHLTRPSVAREEHEASPMTRPARLSPTCGARPPPATSTPQNCWR